MQGKKFGEKSHTNNPSPDDTRETMIPLAQYHCKQQHL